MRNEIDYKAFEMAYSAAVGCKFLKTKDELRLYVAVLYKSILWGWSDDKRWKEKKQREPM